MPKGWKDTDGRELVPDERAGRLRSGEAGMGVLVCFFKNIDTPLWRRDIISYMQKNFDIGTPRGISNYLEMFLKNENKWIKHVKGGYVLSKKSLKPKTVVEMAIKLKLTPELVTDFYLYLGQVFRRTEKEEIGFDIIDALSKHEKNLLRNGISESYKKLSTRKKVDRMIEQLFKDFCLYNQVYHSQSREQNTEFKSSITEEILKLQRNKNLSIGNLRTLDLMLKNFE